MLTKSLLALDGWWDSHWIDAAEQVRSFLGEDGLELAGKDVADLGCGDGTITGGLASLTGARLTGYDILTTDEAGLESAAHERGIDLSSLDLRFVTTPEDRFDAPDAAFDLAVSWSVLEHVGDLGRYLREAHRIIKPGGHLFVQVWPLWHSAHGHHLSSWLDPWDHLRFDREALLERVARTEQIPRPFSVLGTEVTTVDEYLAATGTSRTELLDAIAHSYDSCNRATLEDMTNALVGSGFQIARFSLQTDVIHVPVDLQHIDPRQLTISGVKMTCVRVDELPPTPGDAVQRGIAGRLARRGRALARHLDRRNDRLGRLSEHGPRPDLSRGRSVLGCT